MCKDLGQRRSTTTCSHDAQTHTHAITHTHTQTHTHTHTHAHTNTHTHKYTHNQTHTRAAVDLLDHEIIHCVQSFFQRLRYDDAFASSQTARLHNNGRSQASNETLRGACVADTSAFTHCLYSYIQVHRGVVLQLFVQTYHRLLPAFWHFYNQCLFNSFRQVIWLECESKVSLSTTPLARLKPEQSK